MISDFQTNTIYLSQLLSSEERFRKVYNELLRVLKSFSSNVKLLPKTRDIWARDYMPIQIDKSVFIEYRYDPDYLQGKDKGLRDLKTYPDLVCDRIGLNIKKSDLIIDGGNIVKSKNSIIMTDKVVYENRYSYSKKTLINALHDIFKVENVILIPWDRKEVFGHSDGMVRFIDDKTVLVNHYLSNDTSLLKILKNNGLAYEFLSFKNTRLSNKNWAYINFLQTKDMMIVPVFGINEDEEALVQIEKYFQNYSGRIASVDMSDVVRYGGALNCITWTVME